MHGVYIDPAGCPIDWPVPAVVAVEPLVAALLTHLLRDDLPTDERHHAECLLFAQLRPLPDVRLDAPLPADPRAAAVANALLADPADARSLDAWGRTVGASVRTLARLWVDETGMGFAQWRTRARLQAALPLLAEGLAVSGVARAVGYQTSSAFVAAFRREVGLPPGRYLARRHDAAALLPATHAMSG